MLVFVTRQFKKANFFYLRQGGIIRNIEIPCKP